MRRAAVLLAALLLLAGCATIRAQSDLRSKLRSDGFSGVSVNFQTGTGDGDGVVTVAYTAGPAGNRTQDDVEAASVVWRTLSYRFSYLRLARTSGACVGTFCTGTSDYITISYDQLSTRFGPRDPSLDRRTVGHSIRSLGIAIVAGIGVAALVGLAIVVLVIVLIVRSSRRHRQAAPPPGPWGPGPPPGQWGPPPGPPPGQWGPPPGSTS